MKLPFPLPSLIFPPCPLFFWWAPPCPPFFWGAPPDPPMYYLIAVPPFPPSIAEGREPPPPLAGLAGSAHAKIAKCWSARNPRIHSAPGEFLLLSNTSAKGNPTNKTESIKIKWIPGDPQRNEVIFFYLRVQSLVHRRPFMVAFRRVSEQNTYFSKTPSDRPGERF